MTTAQMAAIVGAIEGITGRASRWSGRLIVQEDLEVSGKKLFECDIVLDADVASRPEGWRTAVHEALHASSVGYSRAAFRDHIGWEEGAVEFAQRLLRREILAGAGISFDEAAQVEVELRHSYTKYVLALSAFADELGLDYREFALELLALPLASRESEMTSRGLLLGRVVATSKLNAIMRQRPYEHR